jgi:ribosomal protein S18 acetylase RimI-like enzyme
VETTEQLTDFLEGQRDDDGHAALSEAKMRSIGIADRVVSIADDGELVAVGVAATHAQPDGTTHWGVETVVIRPMQFPAFEDATLERALELVPEGAQMSVWSRRRSLDLPLAATTALPVVRVASGDKDRLLSVNHGTFGTHREAGGRDESELAQLMSERWFDADGVLFHHIDGVDAAFCWTKLHPNGDGEIYRIGVDPRFQGSGLGRQIVIAGYEHLYTRHGSERGTLWVDESNRSAVRIYEGIGMQVEARNREFSPEVD